MTDRTEVSFGDTPVTGSMTGTFLGADPSDISFVGSASWADTTKTASIATFAETSSISLGGVESASFADTASIVLGGIESATFAVTAAFTETASIATNAETATLAEIALLAETASFVISASFADRTIVAEIATRSFNSDTASFVTASNVQGTVESASFAETASIALGFPPGGQNELYPVSVFLEDTTLLNIQEPISEVVDGRFNWQLAPHRESHLAVTITDPSKFSGRPRLALQFSLDGGTSWDFLDGVDGPYVDITGSVTASTAIRLSGPDVSHISESFTFVELRVITYSGSAGAPFESPSTLGLYWFIDHELAIT